MISDMQFTLSAPRTVKSECKRYRISWDKNVHGAFYNVWYETKHLTGTYDKHLAKQMCIDHANGIFRE